METTFKASSSFEWVEAQALGGKYSFSGPKASAEASIDAGWRGSHNGNDKALSTEDKAAPDKWFKTSSSAKISEYEFKAGDKMGNG